MRYCPDIYGTYKKSGEQKKGFVIDCKHYESGRSIDKADRYKLIRDQKEVQKNLRINRRIRREDFEVKRMFVTTNGNGNTAISRGFPVITVGTPGAPNWKTKLKDGFKDAME